MPLQAEMNEFAFRPWVRRAGLSIVLVALAATLGIVISLIVTPVFRFGWMGERFVWIYIGTLWLGGLKVFLGTLRPVAVVTEERLVLRPLHNVRQRTIGWDAIAGTEQMIGGDRLIVFYETPRGQRFAALNLNLVKGRREFLATIEERLRRMGFVERVQGRSRYLHKDGG